MSQSLFCAAVLLLCSLAAAAQTADAKDAIAILELGAASSTSLSGGGSSFGPNVAVEVTPIENWLELEIGVTPLFRRHRSAEWNTDLLFKKPWDISKKFEFMAGLGPEWSYTKEAGKGRNSFSLEAALDLMYWPHAKRRLGMFIEPAFEYSFSGGHERSFGVTAGLLIAIK
jgi:hypothetical protein